MPRREARRAYNRPETSGDGHLHPGRRFPGNGGGSKVGFLRRPAGLFLSYVALIWLTLPLLPPVVGWVRDRAGSRPIALLTPLAALVPAALVAGRLLRGRCARHARLTLPAVAVGAVAVLFYLRGNPVEQIHLLEYGLLGFLGLRAAREASAIGRAAALFWGCAVPLAGLADEVIQGFLPNRVFDWRDVGVNAVSGLLGMALASSLEVPRRCTGRQPDGFDPADRGGV